MKRFSMGLLVAAAGFAGSGQASLLVTGVFDGPQFGGEPKVIELFVTADIADLSTYGVGAANNGGGTDGIELVLSGSANAGDFIYVIEDNNFNDGNGALGDGFNAYFGFVPTLLFDGSSSNGGVAAINGDDAIEVFSGVMTNDNGTPEDDSDDFLEGAVVDIFGEIDVDGTGTAWEHLDGWAYRKDGTGPDGSTFVLDNWTFSGPNAIDGQADNTGPSVFPIGAYTAGGTAPGDTDGDGDIDDFDLLNAISNFTGSLEAGVGGKGAPEGDTDTDADVDDFDLLTMISGFTGSLPVGGPDIPEPGSLALLALGGLLAAGRRRG